MTKPISDTKCRCHCIANDNGRCVVENCWGEIRTFDANFNTQEARKRIYELAAQAFADYFSEEYTDDDLEDRETIPYAVHDETNQ